MDRLLGWLALDGYGFHEGYFHWRKSVEEARPPRRVEGYARHAFDQGLGRSLWFVRGADVGRIAATVGRFPRERRPDLWSGVGLAAAYAGGAGEGALEALRAAAGRHLPEVAQGAAFAAKAREHGGIPAGHTETACRVLCGVPAAAAARVTDTALEGLPADSAVPAYDAWRRRIQDHFRREAV
jgi:hypothetical protein